MKRLMIIGLLLNTCSSMWAPGSPYPFEDGSFMKAQIEERHRQLAASQAHRAYAQLIAQKALESQWKSSNSPSAAEEKSDSEESYGEPLTTAISERTPSKISDDSVFILDEETGEEDSPSLANISPANQSAPIQRVAQPVLFTFSPEHKKKSDKKELQPHTQELYNQQREREKLQTIRSKKKESDNQR